MDRVPDSTPPVPQHPSTSPGHARFSRRAVPTSGRRPDPLSSPTRRHRARPVHHERRRDGRAGSLIPTTDSRRTATCRLGPLVAGRDDGSRSNRAWRRSQPGCCRISASMNADGTDDPAAHRRSRTPGSRPISSGRRTARGSPSIAGARIRRRTAAVRPIGIASDRRRSRRRHRADASRATARPSTGRPTARRSLSIPGTILRWPSGHDEPKPRADRRRLPGRSPSSAGRSARPASWQRWRPEAPRRRPAAGQGRTPGGRARGSGEGGLGCGERIRTSDLRVMSPTSCRCSTPRPVTLAVGRRLVKRTRSPARSADLGRPDARRRRRWPAR